MVNTDAGVYGGSDVGNMGGVEAEAMPWMGQSHAALLRLPPLGALLSGYARRRGGGGGGGGGGGRGG